jgi:15-cis-phytoene synthase
MTRTTLQKKAKVWSQAEWWRIEEQTRARALAAHSEAEAWEIIVKQARAVLRTYSTSFFIVTRFLPPAKRAQVEAIYAAVRYPDELVDTFPLTQVQRSLSLQRWAEAYDTALGMDSLREMLEGQIPIFIASLAQVVRGAGIPPEHYHAFLEAMRLDVWPRRFATLDDLIDSYVYGSAIVVGYFLTYVYGENLPGDFERALRSARALGIALQLTNFLRDVAEDQKRQRIYLPQDMLAYEGLTVLEVTDERPQPALGRVLLRLAAITEDYYDKALADLDAFAPDSQIAIRACIDVYRQLNRKIAASEHSIWQRASVSARQKFKVLPRSKYWRLPLAYLRP